MASDKHAPRPKNDPDVPEIIRTAICELLGLDEPEVRHDARLLEDLGADELDVVELALALEDAYGLEALSEDDCAAWSQGTVADVIRTMQRKGATK